MSEIQVSLIRTGLATIVFGSAFGVITAISDPRRIAVQRAWSTDRRGLVAAGVAGLLADVGSFWFQFAALKQGAVATVAPIIASSPLFVAILSALVLGERLRRIQFLGISVIVGGVILVGMGSQG